MKPNEIKVCVLRIEGTNCEEETAAGFRGVGANAELVHLKQLTGPCPKEMRRHLADYHILALPGGFSAGDYVRAGAIFAARMKSKMSADLTRFVNSERPIIGICNGFQILVEMGMLPAIGEPMSPEPRSALYMNDSARFECIPTLLKHENRGKCAFTSAVPRNKVILVPCAHAEGKLMLPTDLEFDFLAELERNDQVVFRYVDPEGNYGAYPWTPNGSISSIAGICSPSGTVMGMMPHPERVFHRYTHPDWTRSGIDPASDGDGKAIFQSAIDYVVGRF
jgi:phosphoribosylformylglycinamidine synthase I